MELNKVLSEGMGDVYEIFCDMDGTITDFEARFEHFSGLTPDEYRKRATAEFGEEKGIERFWNLIDFEVGMRFFRGMSWMPEGKELWDYISKYKPKILTAPSREECSRDGKLLWVKDNIENGAEVIFSPAYLKKDYAGPNKILIDDNEQNVSDWKARNGIGILYKGNTEQTIRELQQYGI